MGNKAFKTDWQQIFESGDTEYCISITRPMANALISQLEYLRWKTRWVNMPSMDVVKAFIDDIENRLIMVSVDCGHDMTCDDVFDCLETTDDGQRLYDLTRPTAGGNPVQNSVNNTFNQTIVYNVDKSEETICDDYLFAAIKQMIVFMHGKIVDFYESLEASIGNNVVEFAQVLSTVTVVDELSVDTITGALAFLIDNVLDAYGNVADQDLLDSIACDIFCDTKDDCTVTIDDFITYFDARVSDYLPSLSDVTEIINFLNNVGNILVGFPDRIAVDLSFHFLFGIVKLTDSLVGGVIERGNQAISLYTRLKAFSNDTDSDWQLLCDDCTNLCPEIIDWEFLNPSTSALIDSSALIQYLGNNKYRMTTYKDDLGNNTFYVFRTGLLPFSLNFRELISGASFLFLGADNVYVEGQYPTPSATQEQNASITGFYWAWNNTASEPPYIVEFFACPTES